jgi:hypothetical protein
MSFWVKDIVRLKSNVGLQWNFELKMYFWLKKMILAKI